jgi:hypothetical protein
MADFFPTSETTGAADLVSMGAGDFVYVAPQVVLTETNISNFGIQDTAYGEAEIFGSVTANDPVFFEGSPAATTNIQIGQTGVVSDYGGNGDAIDVEGGFYDISNSGQIIADQGGDGILVGNDGSSGAIRNYGTIDAVVGVDDVDFNTDDFNYLDNYGTIAGSSDAVSETRGHVAEINNYGALVTTGPGAAVFGDSTTIVSLVNVGTITGGVTLQAGDCVVNNQGTIIGGIVGGAIDLEGSNASLNNSGTLDGDVSLGGGNDTIVNTGVINGSVGFFGATGASLDSGRGVITGEIECGDGGATVIAGETGDVVIGGAGNDRLQASPTLAAANNAAMTTLDGAGGNNWLIGDGAYVTFDSGDANGGINHINGRLSKMSDVAGDENNTVSYASLSGSAQSVYVNLLDGVAYTCSTDNANTAANSAFTLEDYIRNVPNVIGSTCADLLVCDNGVDNITAGGAGTVMDAGVGGGSQDTFVFTSFASSTSTSEDTINGFKAGVDMLDFSALDVTAANIVIKRSASNHHISTVSVEQTAGVFDAATNLTLSVHTTTAGALTAGSIIF